MTLPITGPFSQEHLLQKRGAGSYKVQKTGYKQARPYNKPTQYDFRHTACSSAAVFGGWPYSSLFSDQANQAAPVWHNPQTLHDAIPSELDRVRMDVLEKARSRALDKLGDPAALLTLMAEYQSNMDFLADAAMYVRDFVKVRRGIAPRKRTTKGGRVLRKPRESITKHLPTKKEIASDYLAIQFVIVPTVGDVTNAMNILDSPIPMVVGKGSAKGSTVFDYDQTSTYWRQRSQHKVEFKARVQAGLTVTNPNLFLANRLGLINLPLTAYEVSPWSFVFDYFVNVSAWLGQFTETAGVTLTDAFYTQLMTDKVDYRYYVRAYPWLAYELKQLESFQSTSMQRRLGLPEVKLHVRAPWRLSSTRASTSIALLLQMLRS